MWQQNIMRISMQVGSQVLRFRALVGWLRHFTHRDGSAWGITAPWGKEVTTGTVSYCIGSVLKRMSILRVILTLWQCLIKKKRSSLISTDEEGLTAVWVRYQKLDEDINNVKWLVMGFQNFSRERENSEEKVVAKMGDWLHTGESLSSQIR